MCTDLLAIGLGLIGAPATSGDISSTSLELLLLWALLEEAAAAGERSMDDILAAMSAALTGVLTPAKGEDTWVVNDERVLRLGLGISLLLEGD